MKKQKNKTTIDGIVYVREDSIKTEIVIGDGCGVASVAVGKNVLVRSSNEGINAGTVVAADETGVVLKNARRLWSLRPKDKSLSWYEGVAKTGISNCSKVSPTVDTKIIIERYSITECDDDAFESIMSKAPNAQN